MYRARPTITPMTTPGSPDINAPINAQNITINHILFFVISY